MPEQSKLSKQELNWISDQRLSRLSDNQEVLIYPMGAERYLFKVLSGLETDRYPIKEDIVNKDVLVIPGYGTSGFLFAQAGARSVTAYDKDPVTIAWMKAFKLYYHYRQYSDQGTPYPSIGELLSALTSWYPPLLKLPHGRFTHSLFWVIHPRYIRRAYIFYMISLVREAIHTQAKGDFALDKQLEFYTGELQQLVKAAKKRTFDTAFVPYLLGVKNVIENKNEIVLFVDDIAKLVPRGPIIVTPSRNTKEFYLIGQSYFTTKGYTTIQAIPGLWAYYKAEDRNWFRTQGLVIFKAPGN